ncbi:MAG TPA: hypothetical protein VF516_25675, partial [Kofleriaceae bacterium]
MRKLIMIAILGGGGLLAMEHLTHGDDLGDADRLTVAVYGDAPYGTSPTDSAQFLATPAFIQSINADPDVRLVLHVGDIHSGKQFCTEAYDRAVFNLWS